MSDATHVIIVAKGSQKLSKALLLIALITGVLNILRLFFRSIPALIGLLVVAIQIFCMLGKRYRS